MSGDFVGRCDGGSGVKRIPGKFDNKSCVTVLGSESSGHHRAEGERDGERSCCCSGLKLFCLIKTGSWVALIGIKWFILVSCFISSV